MLIRVMLNQPKLTAIKQAYELVILIEPLLLFGEAFI